MRGCTRCLHFCRCVGHTVGRPTSCKPSGPVCSVLLSPSHSCAAGRIDSIFVAALVMLWDAQRRASHLAVRELGADCLQRETPTTLWQLWRPVVLDARMLAARACLLCLWSETRTAANDCFRLVTMPVCSFGSMEATGRAGTYWKAETDWRAPVASRCRALLASTVRLTPKLAQIVRCKRRRRRRTGLSVHLVQPSRCPWQPLDLMEAVTLVADAVS